MNRRGALLTCFTACLGLLAAPAAQAGLRAEFLYELVDAGGTLQLSWATPVWDEANGELYVVDRSTGLVNVFNHNGVVVFQFGEDLGAVHATGVLPLEGGDLLVLGGTDKEGWKLVRCNYRGELLREVLVQGLPAAFARTFSPSVLRQSLGKVYLGDLANKKVAVVSPSGLVADTFDLAALMKLSARASADNELRSINVDPLGNILFTAPTLFAAFVLSPEGELRTFGSRGSAPGKFNIVGGIAADEQGRLFVTDLLRSVVMVFDREFNFQGEFGYRGSSAVSLTSPLDLAIAGDQLFVSQSVGGLKVYSVHLE